MALTEHPGSARKSGRCPPPVPPDVRLPVFALSVCKVTLKGAPVRTWKTPPSPQFASTPFARALPLNDCGVGIFHVKLYTKLWVMSKSAGPLSNPEKNGYAREMSLLYSGPSLPALLLQGRCR